MSDFEVKNGVLVDYRGYDEHVIVPGNVTEIGESVFLGQESMSKVTISEGVKVIGDSAFADCLMLLDVVLPSTLTKIKIQAFYNSGIRSIVLPRGLKFIGWAAFGGCDYLQKISYRGTVAEFKNIELDSHIINSYTRAKEVQCTDGSVKLAED